MFYNARDNVGCPIYFAVSTGYKVSILDKRWRDALKSLTGESFKSSYNRKKKSNIGPEWQFSNKLTAHIFSYLTFFI
jgi:hypothetical protein